MLLPFPHRLTTAKVTLLSIVLLRVASFSGGSLLGPGAADMGIALTEGILQFHP